MGYVGGVVDKGGLSYLCVPYGVTYSQYRDIAKKFLGETPERRHEPAADLVNQAHAEAFPCR